jgi:2-dehydrotetronate isomerase
MPKFAANLGTMFAELPFAERFEAASRAGFEAVECLFPYSISAQKFGETLRAFNLKQAMFNLSPGNWEAGERGFACLPHRFDEVKKSVDLGLEYASASGAKRLHLMAGMGDATDVAAIAAYRKSVAYVAEQFSKQGLDVLLEPINARNMPGYFLNDFAFVELLIAQIGKPNIRLQYDVFHRQILHGDVVSSFKRLLPIIGHVQIAGVPLRHEPNEGELNYSYIFKSMDEVGYAGYVGCEYVPKFGTLAGLDWFEPYKRKP